MPSHEEDYVHFHLKLAMGKVEDRERRMGVQLASQSKSVMLKLDKFAQLKKARTKWFSPGFYTSPGGYQVCLAVGPKWRSERKRNTHFGVPVSATRKAQQSSGVANERRLSIELLNQLNDNAHYEKALHFKDFGAKAANSRVKTGHGKGLGFHQFIAHSQLEKLFVKYPRNDALSFWVTTVALHSRTKPWVASSL